MSLPELINKKIQINHKIAFPVLSLLALLIVIYGNSFNGEWHFDDFQNIVNNKNVHITSLSEISKSFSAPKALNLAAANSSRNEIIRPVAYLSFALNYYFGRLDVYGYHLVNFVILFLNSIILFLFIQRTLNLPLLRDKYATISYPVALLATVYWASSPVNVNAVSYIVQRMTSLAGLFYLSSMYLYLLGRTSEKSFRMYLFFVLSFISAILSLGTKEIAIMIPFSIFIYDFLLIDGVKNIKKYIVVVVISVILIGTISVLYISAMPFKTLLNFDRWPFSLNERLLTETKVIVFYMSLLLYPASGRLMLDHDFPLSTSFFDPAVLASISVIFILIMLAYLMSRKEPFISFCIIFFFINHIVEGTVIPLDLVFEHRNYVPSFFFFLPFIVFFIKSIEYFNYKKYLQWSLIALMIFLLASQGHTVSMRNDILSSERLAWEDNIMKAPNLSRPHAIIGAMHFEEGKLRDAFNETFKAVELQNYPNKYQFALYYANLGAAYLSFYDDEEQAFACYKSAISIYPRTSTAYDGISAINLRRGNLDIALENSRRAISFDNQNSNFYVNLGLILLKKGDLDGAQKESSTALLLDDDRALLILAEAMHRAGHYEGAILNYEKALKAKLNTTRVNLALIELSYKVNDANRLKKYIGRLIAIKEKKNFSDLINEELKRNKYAHAYIPDKEMLLKAIYSGMGKLRDD